MRHYACGALLLVTLYSTHARTCSCDLDEPERQEIDDEEAALDDEAPGVVTNIEIAYIQRGWDSQKSGCSDEQACCSDQGQIVLTFTAPRDNRTAIADLGYIFLPLEGSPPEGLSETLFAHPVRSTPAAPDSERQELAITWIDGATDNQESIDFTFAIIARDLGGNQGVSSEIVQIQLPGQAGAGGCSTTTRSPSVTVLFLAGILLALIRRSRG